MSQPLVLSLFPGIGLLDMAFEEEGFCVVRGPDVLWGGDIRRFHPPAGVFGGVIGGPPCQSFSRLRFLAKAQGHTPRFGNLIPEFERCVAEANPRWFVMEEVPDAPVPHVDGYYSAPKLLNNRWIGAEQNRTRRITLGTRDGQYLDVSPDVVLFECQAYSIAAIGSHTQTPPQSTRQRIPKTVVTGRWGSGSAPKGSAARFTLQEACRLQGLPENFLADAPFTAEGKLKAVANGVPLPMGRAIARAVKRAMGYEQEVA